MLWQVPCGVVGVAVCFMCVLLVGAVANDVVKVEERWRL